MGQVQVQRLPFVFVAAAAPQHGRVGDGLGARAGPAHFSEGSDRQVKSREFPHHEEVTPLFAQG